MKGKMGFRLEILLRPESVVILREMGQLGEIIEN